MASGSTVRPRQGEVIQEVCPFFRDDSEINITGAVP